MGTSALSAGSSFFLKFDAFCNIFPRDKGVRQVAYFFSGGTSTLRTHIARY
jgi:hypothetical protein